MSVLPFRCLRGPAFFYWLMLERASRTPSAPARRARSARRGGEPGATRRRRAALSRDPLGNGLRGCRASEAKALERVNAGRAQKQMLLGGLHSLRGDLHAETPPEAHHGVDDRGGVG